MKWYGITGSWRVTNDEVERDVRSAVRKIIKRGDGIVTGGALNVDWFATDEALKFDVDASQIKVFIPAPLTKYKEHYQKRAAEGVISQQQADILSTQLTELQNRNAAALIEEPENEIVDVAAYYDRNSKVVEHSDELLAFQVNKSKGTEDTINKAKAAGKPVTLKQYSIPT